MHYADSEGPRCPPRVAYCFPAEPGSSPQCQTAARLQPSPNPPQAYPLPSPLPSSETQRRGRQAIPANLPGRWEAETRRPFSLPPAPFLATLPLPTTVPPLPAPPMRETAGSCGKLRKTAGCAALGRREAAEQIFSSEALHRRCLRSRPFAAARTSSHKEVQASALPSPSVAFGYGEHSLFGTPAALGRSLPAAVRPPLAGARSAVRHRLHFPTCGQKTTFFTIIFFPPSFHFYFIYSTCNCLWKVKTNWS